MSPEIIAILAAGVALAGFLRRIVTRFGDLGERLGSIEGPLEGSRRKAGAAHIHGAYGIFHSRDIGTA